MASTDSVVCSVDEHGACFTFPDSSREYVQHTVLQHSSVLRSMLRSLLSEGDEQKQLTLVAPRGFLCNWIDLSKLLSREILAHPESLRSVPSDAIVHFLQAADFFADDSAIGKLSSVFATRLFSTAAPQPEGTPYGRTDAFLRAQAAPLQQALVQLPDDLAVAVLRATLDQQLATLDQQLAQLPYQSHALAIRAAFPEVSSSTELEFNCIDHNAATSTSCLHYLSKLPHLHELSIKLISCSAHKKRGTRNLHEALQSALACAESNSTAVSLHVVACCPFSLRALLRSVAHSSSLQSLELIDGRYYSSFTTFEMARALSRNIRELTSLRSLTLRDFPFDSDAWSPSWRAIRLGIETLTQLTQLYIDRCVRAELLASFLPNLSQLQSLNACFTAHSFVEASELHTAVSGLSQLTSLALAESRWPVVRKLLFCRRWWPETQDFTEAYHAELHHAANLLRSDQQVKAMFMFLKKSVAAIGSVCWGLHTRNTLRVLDLSQCCMNDAMVLQLIPTMLLMKSLQELLFAVCTPGEHTLMLLSLLRDCSCLTRLDLTADRPSQITAEFEQRLSELTALRSLGLSSCTTRESMLSRLPLLTTLTALSSLTLDKCIPAAVTDAAFLAGLGELTALQTLLLFRVPAPSLPAAEAFSGAFKRMPALQRLDLSDCMLSESAADALTSGLASLVNLTHLLLDAMFFESRALLYALCPALHEMSSLRQLHIARVTLCVECCSAVGKAIVCPALSSLEQLHVRYCVLEEGSYAAFLRGLVSRRVLMDVEPSNENILHDRDRVLCHQNVTELVWSYNTLEDSEAKTLGSIIAFFPNITHCKLEGLHLAPCSRFKALQGALGRSRQLKHLDMVQNGPWNAEGVIAVAQLVGISRQLRNVSVGQVSVSLSSGMQAAKALHQVTAPDEDPFKCVDLRAFAKSLDRAVRVRVCGMLLFVAGIGVLWMSGRHRRKEKERRRQWWRRQSRNGRWRENEKGSDVVLFERLNRDLRQLTETYRWNGPVLRPDEHLVLRQNNR